MPQVCASASTCSTYAARSHSPRLLIRSSACGRCAGLTCRWAAPLVVPGCAVKASSSSSSSSLCPLPLSIQPLSHQGTGGTRVILMVWHLLTPAVGFISGPTPSSPWHPSSLEAQEWAHPWAQSTATRMTGAELYSHASSDHLYAVNWSHVGA